LQSGRLEQSATIATRRDLSFYISWSVEDSLFSVHIRYMLSPNRLSACLSVVRRL